MPILRRLWFVALVAVVLARFAQATTPERDAPGDTLVIILQHHWVAELAGQRYGLIQFDTPMTTVLLGRISFDLPVRAFVVLAPLVAVPMLAAVGLVMHGRRRRNGYAS